MPKINLGLVSIGNNIPTYPYISKDINCKGNFLLSFSIFNIKYTMITVIKHNPRETIAVKNKYKTERERQRKKETDKHREIERKGEIYKFEEG